MCSTSTPSIQTTTHIDIICNWYRLQLMYFSHSILCNYYRTNGNAKYFVSYYTNDKNKKRAPDISRVFDPTQRPREVVHPHDHETGQVVESPRNIFSCFPHNVHRPTSRIVSRHPVQLLGIGCIPHHTMSKQHKINSAYTTTISLTRMRLQPASPSPSPTLVVYFLQMIFPSTRLECQEISFTSSGHCAQPTFGKPRHLYRVSYLIYMFHVM